MMLPEDHRSRKIAEFGKPLLPIAEARHTNRNGLAIWQRLAGWCRCPDDDLWVAGIAFGLTPIRSSPEGHASCGANRELRVGSTTGPLLTNRSIWEAAALRLDADKLAAYQRALERLRSGRAPSNGRLETTT